VLRTALDEHFDREASMRRRAAAFHSPAPVCRRRPGRGPSDHAAPAAAAELGLQVPGDDIDVHVKDGWVTVKGDVDFQFRSDIAFDDVSRVYGVTGVTNEIKVVERL
jgi:osmotically-inducible protein OsmY